MSSYIPNTREEQKEMLRVIGCGSIGELFPDVPDELKLKKDLELPQPLSEQELYTHMKDIANQNAHGVCFMGGGIYDHFIPAAVGQIIGRQEFYTAYTPYQAEISQGTLQAIFEYQSMICRLTGMEVSNASHYDGGTACAEAMIVAHEVTKRSEVAIVGEINPQYLEVCRTYARYRNISIASEITEATAAVIVQNPNYFGAIEDLEAIGKAAKENGAMFIVIADPISLAMLEPPNADIVVGEGQALGNPMNFGGPGFGFFACRKEYMRKIPGRIVGETTDSEGRRGFVLTLQAREQHIRREKATSNICSNQALCALAATAYMSIMGKEGIKKVAELCLQKAHYMYNQLIGTGKFEKISAAPFFKEFVLKYKGDVKDFCRVMSENGFLPGIPLEDNCILIAVTEKRTRAEIDAYVERAGAI